MASYASRQFYHPGKFEFLKKRQCPSLAELNDVKKNGKVYDLGFVLIDFIKVTWGKETVMDLLRSNGDIETVLNVSECEFESKFHNYIRDFYLKEANISGSH